MIKTYLLIYNDQCGTLEEVKNVVNSMQNILIWRYDMKHVFYITSRGTAQELYDEFSKKLARGRFMFAEITSNAQGLMLNDTWYLLNNQALKESTK